MSGKEHEVHLAAVLSIWLSRFVFRSTGGDDLRPMVFKVASYMATGVRFALAGPALACLYRGLGHAAIGLSSIAQWSYLYSWLTVYFHTHGEDLEGICRPGRLEPTISATARSGEEKEDYDSDRSHPRRQRRKAGSKLASKKRAPLTALNDASASASKKKNASVEAQPASLPLPPTFLPPISKIEPHIEPQPSCPPLELDPPENVQISSSPEVSEAPQEELSHPEATVQTDLCVVAAPEGTEVAPPVVREDVAPSVQEAVEVVQEEAPVIQEQAPAIEEVVEVVQERAPVVQEASVI
ncbi:hypothetical protein H6P81_010286 [Aristolochia fimbriata]|uniref:Aminotransferase-like plant mobile domain-containing protein n=1 Tax=Aristolochia fimbriata TaxID=158543 RepID=A0AAV7EPH3_ARIFI|nr:hypothetical protein H6P81_010286 [Aristolochia fimbriata]